jgi:hypothetical protein
MGGFRKRRKTVRTDEPAVADWVLGGMGIGFKCRSGGEAEIAIFPV